MCIAERDVILMKRVSVSSVGVKCTYIVSHGRLSLTQKKTGFRGRNYRTATRFVGISRMRFGLIVIRGIHNWWFAYVSPEFHEKHPVSLIYHASVCQENMRIMSESHFAKKYQQRKHRSLPIHLINITVTRSRFGSCRVIVQKDRSILYEWRMHSF